MCVVIFHHMSFLMLALAEHPFTCVCFSETFLHMSALAKCHFTCICLSWHHSARVWGSSKKPNTTRRFLECFSLWSPNKWSSTMQCKADLLCLLLAKNPSSHVLSHACFSRTSSLLCLFQLNVPSWVCLSLSPVSTSGKHSFTCLPQQNTF